ncbi:MAG: glycosyltransferase [Planctomycetota bacterium]
MKLLQLASEYASATLATKVYGLGTFVRGVATAQAAQGDEVHVLTNSHGGEEDQVQREGVHLHRIAFPNPPRPSDGHGEVLQWNHGVVARLLDRRDMFRDVDLVVGHDWLTAPAAREAALILDRPLAVVIHDEAVGKHAGVLDREARFARDLEALAVHDSNLVVANSAYIARQVVHHYGVPQARVVTIHGGIDPAFAQNVPTDHQEDFRRALVGEGELLVAYVGRLDPEKGLGVLAEAAHLVAQRAPQVRFALAGTGRREQALRERLGPRGRLLGYVRGEALVRLFRAADVVVVPSVYEPFGLVALEAMLCGAPVVVAGTGGLAEIVRHGQDGVVVPAGDGAALADALLALAADPALREALGAAGRRRAVDTFRWEVIAAKTRQAYEAVLGARPAIALAPPRRPSPPTVSAVVVTRDAPAHAEAALRSLVAHPGLVDVCLLDHGSAPVVAQRLGDVAAALSAEGRPVRLLRAERSASDDQALLLGVEAAQGARVLVLGDEVELLPGEEGLLDGLLWLHDDAGAATVSPTLVSRAQAANPGQPGLAEQYLAPALPRAAFLAGRAELLSALASGTGDLGARLRGQGGGQHWVHPVRVVHGAGEARRSPSAPFAAAPDSPLPASIVVLAYDNLALTRECLESVLGHTPPPFELVLVDNGSRDDTRGFFRALRARLGPTRPVQVIENDQNLGFPAGANKGARAARGRHVVVLNNDTRVCPGWLQALLAAADSEPGVGVVTAKVLNLDLSVQSAGGIVHAPDGSFTIPGQGEARVAPSVNVRRRVTNAGGPCMFLTRQLLERLAPSGEVFDEGFSPGYFEDSDLCFRAREAGFALLYEPAAELVHHGKATASLVAGEGSVDVWGRFELNKRRFHARWAAQLARDASADPRGERASPLREGVRA